MAVHQQSSPGTSLSLLAPSASARCPLAFQRAAAHRFLRAALARLTGRRAARTSATHPAILVMPCITRFARAMSFCAPCTAPSRRRQIAAPKTLRTFCSRRASARTVETLAMVAEVVLARIVSAIPRCSYACGGKDGPSFPVCLKVYEESITRVRSAARRRASATWKNSAIRRLDEQARRLEASDSTRFWRASKPPRKTTEDGACSAPRDGLQSRQASAGFPWSRSRTASPKQSRPVRAGDPGFSSDFYSRQSAWRQPA